MRPFGIRFQCYEIDEIGGVKQLGQSSHLIRTVRISGASEKCATLNESEYV